jgi:superfamily I DNA/RNA helicase
VVLFSAPGEGREAVEIARRLMQEAERGVPFDQMAVLLRAPQTYLGVLEHALDRAGIPAWFHRGTRRPDPAGRALLALLACADENLSARRFAEYVSLGQVPLTKPAMPTGGRRPRTKSSKPSCRSMNGRRMCSRKKRPRRKPRAVNRITTSPARCAHRGAGRI